MKRLDVVSSHLADLEGELPLLRAKALFEVSADCLRHIAGYMEVEMQKGLSNDAGSTLAMIPSYVTKPDTTTSRGGIYYALDLGGTNFRVLRMSVNPDGTLKEPPMQAAFAIAQEHMTGTADALFGFIGGSVAKFAEKFPTNPVTLGFTFSFPVRQRALADGELLTWTKGFTASGMEGQNIAGLLQTALRQHGVDHMKVVALCNDTVGTLIARYVSDPLAHIGVILGTGSNACYWEPTANITKEPAVAAGPHREMVVNIEWGNLGSTQGRTVLPMTPYDEKLDGVSPNPGKQLFEKMISGMYLGETARLVMVDVFPASTALGTAVRVRESVTSKLISQILSDDSPGLRHVQYAVFGQLAVNVDCEKQRRQMKAVCTLIRDRSAMLSAAAIAAILKRTRRLNEDTTVAVDGSVFEKIPGYKAKLAATLRDVFGARSVNLVLSKDGSGIGAGMIAAIVS